MKLIAYFYKKTLYYFSVFLTYKTDGKWKFEYEWW